LTERLVYRFECGYVVGIQTANFEIRVAIPMEKQCKA